MKIISPLDKTICLPLRISHQTDLINNGKLGGRPPQGIFPEHNLVSLKYFATVKFSEVENLFISIFVADFELLLGLRGKINKLGFVDIVIHKPQQRESNATFQSEISEHDFQLLNVEQDFEQIDGEPVFLSGHKIGGNPHLIRDKNNLSDEVAKIFENNFRLIVQIDFPGNKDEIVSGDWYFGDGIFSLFGKSPFSKEDWLWYWDM